MDAKPVPRWQTILAIVYAIGIIAVIVAFNSRLGPDFIPLDNSRIGPNILASIVIATVLTVIGVLLWPPTRRRLHRFADQKLAPLHTKVDQLHARHDEHARSLEDLHSKIDALGGKR